MLIDSIELAVKYDTQMPIHLLAFSKGIISLLYSTHILIDFIHML